MSDRPFQVRFPGVQLREEYGGKRAIVIMSAKPANADQDLVLSTCMDIDGKLWPNVPMSFNAIKAGAFRPVFLVEQRDDGILVPMGGLVGVNGKPL